QHGADRLLGHRQVALLVDLRRAADQRHERDPGQGRGVVRQRVGLRDPPGRARRAGPRARAGAAQRAGRGGGVTVTTAPATVLVAYASKHDSTAEIAERIAMAMRSAGQDAEARAAAE